MQPQLQIPQTQQHHLQLQHPSKTTRHPSTLSPQELDLDYDYDDIDIFPTGLTPDLTWIDLPVAARNADTADISTSNLSVRDAFDILDISLPDPVGWSPYESSASGSVSSMPSHQPNAEALSRSSSPSTATVTATAMNTLSDDSFQFINAAPVAAGTGTGMTLTTPPEPGPGPQTRPNLLLLPKSTATSSPTGNPFDSSLAKTRGVSKRQLNTEAARRYRQRKVDRMNQLEEELELIKKERDELRMRVSKLAGETEGLKRLLDVKT